MKQADKVDELLEVLDENGVSTGRLEKREVVHNNLLFHNEIALWIIDKENREVLVQRRSPNKKSNPNKIALCAGHVVGRETIYEALAKEAYEEIGIDVSNYNVHKICIIKRTESNNYCYSHHFYILDRIPIESMKIQEEELSEVFYMDYEKLKNMIKNSDSEVGIHWSDGIAKVFENLDKVLH